MTDLEEYFAGVDRVEDLRRENFKYHYQRLGRRCEIAKAALEQIADPRKRDHQEPDKYTEVGCLMHLASEALDAMGRVK